MVIEKGLLFKTTHNLHINQLIDKYQDEDNGKWCYYFLEAINTTKYNTNYIESDKELVIDDDTLDMLGISKYSYNIYEIIQNKDVLLVYIDDIDYITQVISEDNELVVYIKGKRYTIKDLIELDAINKISTKWEALENSLSLEDIKI